MQARHCVLVYSHFFDAKLQYTTQTACDWITLRLDDYINIPRVITCRAMDKSKYFIMYICRQEFSSNKKQDIYTT